MKCRITILCPRIYVRVILNHDFDDGGHLRRIVGVIGVPLAKNEMKGRKSFFRFHVDTCSLTEKIHDQRGRFFSACRVQRRGTVHAPRIDIGTFSDRSLNFNQVFVCYGLLQPSKTPFVGRHDLCRTPPHLRIVARLDSASQMLNGRESCFLKVTRGRFPDGKTRIRKTRDQRCDLGPACDWSIVRTERLVGTCRT